MLHPDISVAAASAHGRALAHRWLIVLATCASVAAAQAPPAEPGFTTLHGVVRQYLVNEFGDTEGLIAEDGTQVRFPVHMGADLVATLKPHDAFVAEGDGAPALGFRAYTLGKPGRTPLTEARPSPGAGPLSTHGVRHGAPGPMDAAGAIVFLLHAPRGEVDGVLLADGTIVRLSPRGRRVAATRLVVGTWLRATGLGSSNAYGRCLRADHLGFGDDAIAPVEPEGPRAPPSPDAGVSPPT